jgi:hypothetical protein
MFPLSAISTGLGLIGGIEGLLGGDRKQKEAEEAEQQALVAMQAAGNQEYSDALAGGQRNLYGLTGVLGDALRRTGSNLGAANAAGGVYNSSATAGDLAQQGTANAATIGSYATGLADTLAQIRNSNAQKVAGLQYGLAQNNLNYARQLTAGSAAGLGSAFSQLGQLTMGSAIPGRNTGVATTGGNNAAVTMPNNDASLGTAPAGYQNAGSPLNTMRFPQPASLIAA